MVVLIGIDCATQPSKVGLALGELQGGTVRIRECQTGSTSELPHAVISSWLRESGTALLALDAPLGWSKALGDALAGHQAGVVMGACSDQLFRRATDLDIKQRFQKRPLEVGANLISRTSVAALELLEQLREQTRQDIPLAWCPGDLRPMAAIEVYPAATRLAHGAPDRSGSLVGLEHLLDCSALGQPLPQSADAIDALVCVLAAADFISGKARPPADQDLARIEGWIWTAERTADRGMDGG
jgi:hypothetical protein